METENKTFNFGSPELKAAVIENQGNFFKAEVGKIYLVTVDKTKEIKERVVTFDNKLIKRFDISVTVEGVELTWSIGKRNLKFINDAPTNKFNVLRTKENYNIIPLINP